MDALQGTFRALADPTRRAILSHLAEREMTIGDVAGHFEMTRAAVKKHLVVLEQGHLIRMERRGRERINRLEPAGLRRAARWLQHFDKFWDERLDALQAAVANEEKADDE